eukprot:TRINITY_DN6901_c0_g1_i1.p1 TRINITY_DN6901_c0_g1~~TRINITY_DN6901_c0_g1_i1.p1  ORF type:complete len:204 (-),score=21.96 TRINITY_DN6901_c0_g1_i1:32-643(-)
MMREDQIIIDLLQTAVGKPLDIDCESGGAFLALACHCLMVRWGFTLQEQDAKNCHSAYNPPHFWNARQNLWQFSYNKDGKCGEFELYCSFDQESGRLLVHVEECGTSNVHLYSLKVSNYIGRTQDLVKCRSWDDLDFPSISQRYFAYRIEQNLIRPLCQGAQNTPCGYCTPTGSPRVASPKVLIPRVSKKRRSLRSRAGFRTS